MSTCESLKTPKFDQYIDNEETTTDEEVVGIDNINLMNPQFCATIASDIYKHLRESEESRRPSMDFMESIQNDINASMRAILIDWLVEVAECFRLVPDTLFLAVNYVDRYLSRNAINRDRLQLLGVTCMMIAARYEEDHNEFDSRVERFCDITDNTYVKEEVLQMESAVLRHLEFEMTAPTAMCFLTQFCFVPQHNSEVPLVVLQCLASYIAELSLVEYTMLCYAPSLIAASAVFLAKYILCPSKKPWSSALRHYTFYQASDLCDCVNALHRLHCNASSSDLPAVWYKYNQKKYKFIENNYCLLPSVLPEFFQDSSN